MEALEINTGVINANKEFLRSLEVPRNTRTWKPVGHGQLIDITMESLDKCGFNLHKEIYTYSAEGAKANGKYHLNYGNDPDMGLMIAWQNSYNKTLSLKFAIGGHVFICENGVISGDMGAFKSKHMGQIQEITPKLLREYICSAGDTFEVMVKEKQKMKDIEITKKATAELLGRMFINEGIITSTQLNIIKKEIDKPTFDYGNPGSVWELYNYDTFALKSASPDTWMKQQIQNHKFFKKEFKIGELV